MSRSLQTASNPAGTTNPCRCCAPLGACLVFKGISGALPLLHGSQGCSTYIRRYLIGHFREPADIASSSFSEETTIFGGGDNLRLAIGNIVDQYHPSLIGIATTCLAETIGEDLSLHLYPLRNAGDTPPLVQVNCPSYVGSHADGFRNAVIALVNHFARRRIPHDKITVFPGMLSCAELRHVRYLLSCFRLEAIMVPDYSQTLDGGAWDTYHLLPEGGTTVDELVSVGSSRAAISFETEGCSAQSPLAILKEKCGVEGFRCAYPLGIDACDALCSLLSNLSGNPLPDTLSIARSRLVDAYIDGHKFVAGATAAVYGDHDQVTGLVRFLLEIGMQVTAVVISSKITDMQRFCDKNNIGAAVTIIRDDADFSDLRTVIENNKPDLLIGNSKGYHIASALDIPLIRTGFPVHDRIGGQRLMHIGYDGTITLFEAIVNTLIGRRQSESAVGYMTW